MVTKHPRGNHPLIGIPGEGATVSSTEVPQEIGVDGAEGNLPFLSFFYYYYFFLFVSAFSSPFS